MEVGLLRFEDFGKTQELEKRWDDYHSKVFSDLANGKDRMTDDDLAQLRRKTSVLSDALGLSNRGEDYKNVSRIEQPSNVHPDHLFKVGTMVDTMDEFALSVVLGNLGIHGIHAIFGDHVQYVNKGGGIEYIRPDWSRCFDNVCDAKSALVKAVSEGRNFMVSTLSGVPSVSLKSPYEAVSMFQEQRAYAHAHKLDRNYVNQLGWFFMNKPLSIRAAISGTVITGGVPVPATYLVYNVDMDWYMKALDIICETIEYVLSRSDDRNKYWLKFDTHTLI